MNTCHACPQSPAANAPIVRGAAALLLAAMLLFGAAGCANIPPGEPTVRNDPWEHANRHVFAFNEGLDEAVIKPAAQIYQKVVPRWLRTGIGNMFGNLADAWTSVNLMLQAKPQQSLNMVIRTGLNTTLGVAGFFDIGEEVGLERVGYEDLGQTLGVWGVKSGPYVVLPLFGPSTVRDTFGKVVDVRESGPALVLSKPRERNAASALQLLNTRVSLFGAENFLNEIALDKYVLVRDAYLARRRSLIYDGDPPDEE